MLKDGEENGWSILQIDMVQLSCIPKLESHQLSFRSAELHDISALMGYLCTTDPEESVSSQKPRCLPSINH